MSTMEHLYFSMNLTKRICWTESDQEEQTKKTEYINTTDKTNQQTRIPTQRRNESAL